MQNDHPYVSSYKDRHGTTRWRFQRAGKSKAMPGQPGEPVFERAYKALLEGRAIPRAEVVRGNFSSNQKTMRTAWMLVPKSSPEWRRLSPDTQARQVRIAEAWLNSRVDPRAPLVWGEVPIVDLRRRHVKNIISEMSDTPHAARHLLTVVRRMVLVALDYEWVDVDPTYKISHRPAYGGWKAWPDEMRDRFEQYWAIGTTPRLVYALALWIGNRRSDIATLRVDAIDGDRIQISQQKTGRELVLEITPMLREVLDATDLSGPTILKTSYGKPFSAKSLTNRMADWTKEAGLPPGHTLHGLRKSLGKMLAEGGATTRQIMDTLGHTDIKHAELYSREADQKRLARDGMGAVVRLVSARKAAR